MGDFKPDFAFSFSRWKTFAGQGSEGCPRKYWLETIGSWGGWEVSAPPRAQLLYRLSKLETLFSLSGKVVHSTIKEGLEDLRLSAADARDLAHDQMRSAWVQSLERLSEQQPPPHGKHPAKTFTRLAEHHYPRWGAGGRFGTEDPKETAPRAWARAEAAIFRAWETEEFLEARESRILALEDLPKEKNRPALVVEWVPTWVRLDLAYERSRDRLPPTCVIVDWKTGRPRPDADGAQLQLYALFAHQVKGGALDRISARAVYLGSDPVRVVESKPTPESIAALRESIPRAAGVIQERLPDPELNVAPEENFERCEDRSQCATCAMFEGCYGHRDIERPTEAKAC